MIVAHYTNIRKACLILEGEGLRFSKLANLNDPYESCQKFPGVEGRPEEVEAIDEDENFAFQTDVLSKYLRIACFTMPYLTNKDPKFSAAFNMPMWAHYAESESRNPKELDSYNIETIPEGIAIPGVVLLLDLNVLLEQLSSNALFELICARPVSYFPQDSDQLRKYETCPAVREVQEIKREIIRISTEKWFNKSSDWIYEREYRIMIYDDSSSQSYLDVGQALVGIVTQFHDKPYGNRFPLLRSERDFLNRYKDKHYELWYEPNNQYYKLMKNEMKVTAMPHSFFSDYYLIDNPPRYLTNSIKP